METLGTAGNTGRGFGKHLAKAVVTAIVLFMFF